jgi:hypothetical protein
MKKVVQRAGGVDGGKGVEGKKPGKIDLKKLLKLGLVGIMALISAVGAFADPVVGKVMNDGEVVGNNKEYLMDLSHINRQDKIRYFKYILVI